MKKIPIKSCGVCKYIFHVAGDSFVCGKIPERIFITDRDSILPDCPLPDDNTERLQDDSNYLYENALPQIDKLKQQNKELIEALEEVSRQLLFAGESDLASIHSTILQALQNARGA